MGVDETICLVCGGSTFVGETISCETCLHWYHFNCVGVTHNDDCVVKEDVPYFCPSCNEQERRAKKAKKQQQQLQHQQQQQLVQNSQISAGTSSNTGKSPRHSSSSSHNQVAAGSRSKLNRKSPEKEAARKNIHVVSKVGNGQPVPSKRSSGSSRMEKMSPKNEGGLGEEEMNLAIEEVQRQSGEGVSSPGVVAVERLPAMNTLIEGYSAIPNNPWDNLNHTEEVVAETEVQTEEESEDEEEEQPPNDDVKTEPVKKVREVSTGLQEEEAWLQAVESGNLQQVYSCDSELRSVREPTQLTARQRALGGEDGVILSQLEFGSRAKEKTVSELTEEEKNVKALKRKEIETEKRERQKQKTMDTLLKKKDSKATKQIKTLKSNRNDTPKISYTSNSFGAQLSLPEGYEYPLKRSGCRTPPPVIPCILCPNPKKYNSSATGAPVCSLACYKMDLARPREIASS